MWKVLLVLGCVAGSAIVFCDDTSSEDCADTDSTYDSSSSSSSSSRSSTSSASESSLSSKGLTKSSSNSESASSLSSSSTPSKTIKHTEARGSDDTSSCGDDPNSHPGCGVNCGRTCSTYKEKDVACILVCYDNGCDCNAGYVYDPNVKKCVVPKNCTPTCGLNEVYSTCTNGGCSRRNCSQLGKPQVCVKIRPESCIEGCVCADGYLRSDNGTCVPENQCPQTGCGGDPNAQPGCGYNCRKKCSDYKSKNPYICPRLQCKPDKCDCKDGYVLDQNIKKCVRPEECTPICGRNEQYSSCTNGGCGHRNCSQVGTPQICIDRTLESCTKGCICSDGYLRAANGTCVPKDQCPAVDVGCGGDPNAHSGCGVNCGRTCSTYKNKGQIACTLICNLGGCDCNEGYVFDPSVKKCVLPNDCTPTCGRNEVLSSCTNGYCGRRKCSELGGPILCVDPIPGGCIKGCVCADGYLRADNGTCVPEDQCSSGCGGDPNAEKGCGYHCGNTCTTYKDKHPICPRIACKPDGCECKKGFVFDSNLQKCVLPLECGCSGDPHAKPGCGVNCGKTCTTYKVKNPVCPLICKVGGCDCINGYVYDDNVKKCVLPEDCSTNCPINEVYDVCPAPCPPRRCDVDDRVIRCAAPPKPGDPACKPGCRCADGYARLANGTCVLRDQCEQPLPCNYEANEIYDSCPAPCPGQSCDVDPALVLCAPNPEYGDPRCKPACRCLDGYVRNAGNQCIPRDQCPPKGDDRCTGQNEFYDTCISGCSNQTCDSIGKIFNCPIQPAVCREGCRCRPGFYRNTDNVCVAESDCPAPPCPDGEVYSRCPTVRCEGDYCQKTRDSPTRCPVGIVCDAPRCVCAFGRRRDYKTGKCIQNQDCPAFKCNGPNEEYKSCPATCPSDTCTAYVAGRGCPPFIIGIRVPCQPQCKCKKGYYRNDAGVCVEASKCGPSIATTSTRVSLEPTSPTTTNNPIDGLAALRTGVTDFNNKFLYNRMKADKGKNLITSPYSVFTPLVQLALYATGDSFKQLTNVLNVNTKEQIRSAFPALAASFEGQTSVNFSMVARIYSDINFPISDRFKKDSVDVVHASAQELDFSKNTEAAKTINAWVESQTNNRIHDLIQPADLSPLTRLVLVNAIYFKGLWRNAFNKTNTIKNADFYLSDGTTKKTSLMYQERQFNHGEIPELNCTVLEMFYKGNNFSMIVVLPNEKDGVMSLAGKLQVQANFDKVMGSMRTRKVKVYVPPFTTETTTDLTDILKQVGVTAIFNPQNSGLSGIMKTAADTHVSKAVQKAFIEVNEEGSEAAAANGLVVGVTAVFHPEPPKEIIFRCDHGFLYYIVCKNSVLFAGSVVDVV